MRIERSLVLPQALVLALLYVGLNRLILLAVLVRYPPNPGHAPNVTAHLAFWEFWFVQHGGLASVQKSLMLVNVLLVLLIWARFRGLPRGSSGLRLFQLVTFGGAAAVLAYQQYYLYRLTLIEPLYELKLISVLTP
ncbi:MAG: hypothetical protein GY769_14635 [bacterium]|nr:hypothetical protein [bacterium]